MIALVVLPGLDGTATLHAEFVTSVGPAFDSVAVIPYPSDEALGYAALEGLVRAQLPPATPFVLLGESFSGPIALSIAADPPPNLVGLVLSTTFAKAPVPLLSPLAALARIAPVRSLPPSVLSWLLLGRWATPQLEASLQTALLAVSPAVLRFRAAAAYGPMYRLVSAQFRHLSSTCAPLTTGCFLWLPVGIFSLHFRNAPPQTLLGLTSCCKLLQQSALALSLPFPGISARALTIHSSRSRFAARLNSGVSPHVQHSHRARILESRDSGGFGHGTGAI